MSETREATATKTRWQAPNVVWLSVALLGVYALFTMMVYFANRSVGANEWAMVNSRTMIDILRQTAVVGIAGLGMTLVIVLGEIDLSVGSVIALCAVAAARVLDAGPIDPATGEAMHHVAAHPFAWPLLAIAAALGAGVVVGLIVGYLVAYMKLMSFIVTLGMLGVARGAAQWLAGNTTVDPPVSWANWLLDTTGPLTRYTLLPPGVWIMLLLALGVAGLMRYTRFGRHIVAIGSNEDTARLCGVAVERVKVAVFVLMGALTGAAAMMQFAYDKHGSGTAAVGLELDVIAAVVIGGGSLSGGEGSVPGTIIGALIMAVIATGCSMMGWPNYVRQIVTGSVIVAAVAVDRLRHRRVS